MGSGEWVASHAANELELQLSSMIELPVTSVRQYPCHVHPVRRPQEAKGNWNSCWCCSINAQPHLVPSYATWSLPPLQVAHRKHPCSGYGSMSRTSFSFLRYWTPSSRASTRDPLKSRERSVIFRRRLHVSPKYHTSFPRLEWIPGRGSG